MSMLANRKPARKPRPKPARTIRLAVPLNGEGKNGVVRIAVGRAADDYLISRVPSAFGSGFLLEKVGDAEGAAYHVHLSGEGPSCECRGFLRWDRCKHADGLAALQQHGKL